MRGTRGGRVKNAGGAPAAPSPPEALDLAGEIERLHARSYGWALSCCGWDGDEAADVLQLAYLKLLDGRARYAGRSLFSTFLFGVIRRTAAERRRRRTTRKLLLLRHADAARPAAAQTAEPLPVRAGHLQAALGKLPRRQREVLHLVFYDERSVREAAEIMGIGIGSARVHYDRAKKRLRECLREEYEQGTTR